MSIQGTTLHMSAETQRVLTSELLRLRDLSYVGKDLALGNLISALQTNVAPSTMPKERFHALEAIHSERDYQNERWGDKVHEVGGFILIMETHLHAAREKWTRQNNDHDALESIRKVTGVGVACMEQYYAPMRKK